MSEPTPLASAWQHAHALRGSGDFAGAKILLEHAIEAGGAAYGIDHPDVLETGRLLAGLHRETGDLAAARRTLEEALAAGQVGLAENHPLMLLLAYDLGTVADELGNRHEARRNLAKVARLGPAALGDQHPAVRAAAAYLDHGGFPAPTPPPAPPAPSSAVTPPARFMPTSSMSGGNTPGLSAGQPVAPRRRTALVVAAVVAGVVLAAAGTTAAVLAALRPAPADGPGTAATPATSARRTSAAPRTAGAAPTDVRLHDDGTSVTLIWRDPSPGTVPFIVAGGRAGEQARPFANLPAGKTSHTLFGLNPRLEYCFTIVAVYSTESFTASELVCTRRTTRSPQPTRS